MSNSISNRFEQHTIYSCFLKNDVNTFYKVNLKLRFLFLHKFLSFHLPFLIILLSYTRTITSALWRGKMQTWSLSMNFYYLWKRGYKLWRNLFPLMIVKFRRQWKRYIVKQTHPDFLPWKNTESIMSHNQEGKSTGMTGRGGEIYHVSCLWKWFLFVGSKSSFLALSTL